MNQKQILHFVLWNSSQALERNNLYLPSTFSPQIWKRVNISTLLQSAEMDWCASVYLCFMAQRKLWAERTEACSKPLTCQPAGTATTLPAQMLNPHLKVLFGRVTDHRCVKQHQRGLRCTTLCRDHCLRCNWYCLKWSWMICDFHLFCRLIFPVIIVKKCITTEFFSQCFEFT